MAEIYYTTIESGIGDRTFDRLLGTLPTVFRARISTIKHPLSAQCSLSAALLLRYAIIQGDYDLNFRHIERSTNGKLISNSLVNFNISHSESTVVCALTVGGSVGVDVEVLRPIRVEDFQKVLTVSEWNWLEEQDNRVYAWFDLWTKKEATLKAEGTGLTVPLQDVRIRFAENLSEYNGNKYPLKTAHIADHCIVNIASTHVIDSIDVKHVSMNKLLQ